MKAVLGIALVGLLCLAAPLPGFSQTSRHAASTKARIAHGEYLVKGVSGCGDCHTPMNNRGEPVAGQWLKGTRLPFGPLVPIPGWAATSADIAGLKGWTTKDAIRLFMTGLDPAGHAPRPPMPQYHMNRADATAVVAYLQSLQ